MTTIPVIADSSIPLTAVVSIVGICVSFIGGLILFNLRGLKICVTSLGIRNDQQDEKIENCRETIKDFNVKISACKIDCDRNNVSKEDWVRSEGYTRKELRDLTAILNRMDGKLGIIEQLPAIVSNIARELAKEMKSAGGTPE